MERKLASIRRIKEIRNHPNADLLDLAIVDGWQLVTAKDNGFKAGDLVIYFEIDSFLPICEEFEFLRKSCYKKMGEQEGFRLRTIKLRGELSQGLIIPITDFPDVANLPEGADLSEQLGVLKWEPPIPAQLAGVAKGNFPSFIQKTDQERIQNIIDNLDLTSIDSYEVTVKLDGSSCTIYNYEDENGPYVGVCSRNLDLLESEGNSFWRVAHKTGLVEALKKLKTHYAIQGELMGPGIQGNRENLTDIEFYVFDIYSIDEQRYLNASERHGILSHLQQMGVSLNHVPILLSRPLSDFNGIEDFLDLADNTKSLNHNVAEGVVFKRLSDNKSFKVISNKFLLKEKD